MRYENVDAAILHRWHDEALAGLCALVRDAPEAALGFYPGSTVRHLAVHVVRVHRMASASLQQGSRDRPKFDAGIVPTASPDALADALRDAAQQVRRDLADRRHSEVWTPSPSTRPEFWRRRMLSESVLHRWDAEDAVGRLWQPGADVALEVIDEFVGTRLGGVARLTAFGRLQIVTGRVGWALPATGSDEVTFTGRPVDVWLWLNRRRAADVLDVDGPAPIIAAVEGHLDELQHARV